MTKFFVVLLLLLLLGVLLVSCAPPENSYTYLPTPTSEPDSIFSKQVSYYIGRVVDKEFGYICYYHAYDGGIWCDKLNK